MRYRRRETPIQQDLQLLLQQTLLVQLIQQHLELITQQEHQLQQDLPRIAVLIVRAVHLRITIILHRVQVAVQEAHILHLRVQVVAQVVVQVVAQVVARVGQVVQVAQAADADKSIFRDIDIQLIMMFSKK